VDVRFKAAVLGRERFEPYRKKRDKNRAPFFGFCRSLLAERAATLQREKPWAKKKVEEAQLKIKHTYTKIRTLKLFFFARVKCGGKNYFTTLPHHSTSTNIIHQN
jgi:hypothetical protein